MGIKAGLTVLSACLLTACSGPTGPATTSPPPPSPAAGSIAHLAGNYDLTIDIPERCADAARIAPTLAYGATLTASQYRYLSMTIGRAARGDLWPGGTTSVRLSLNNFDINGCDGVPELLADGRLFNICATGALEVSGSTIAGTVEGVTWIGEGHSVSGTCGGAHRFTFTRRMP